MGARIIRLPSKAGLVQLDGELDLAAEGCLRDCLTCALALAPDVVVDMRRVQFMDCAALGVLVQARNLALAERGSVVLVAPPRAVRRLLALTGLDDAFPARNDLRDAVEAVVTARRERRAG